MLRSLCSSHQGLLTVVAFTIIIAVVAGIVP